VRSERHNLYRINRILHADWGRRAQQSHGAGAQIFGIQDSRHAIVGKKIIFKPKTARDI